ncbi:MAG: YggT family protein [Anaerolineae bacterium]|nr:YggT family protein [Anaerolineae bacterium]
MEFLFILIDWTFTLYALAILARSILTMLRVNSYHPAMNFLIQITEPLLAPLRRHIRPIGIWDITPMVALIIVWVAHLIVIQIVKMTAMLLGAM